MSNSITPATVEIEIGKAYPFYCEIQEEYRPASERLRRYTGTIVTVEAVDHERDEECPGFLARTWDGQLISVNSEEINGWDYELDQFFWVDGTYGKGHAPDFLGNERAATRAPAASTRW